VVLGRKVLSMGVIRRIYDLVVGVDPANGVEDNLDSVDEVHNLSDHDDALESFKIQKKVNFHCGCFGVLGGRCSECSSLSCQRCFQHCGGTDNPNPMGCGKPLCREHSHLINFDEEHSIAFCKTCYSKISRKEIRNKAACLLLSPFVEPEESK